MRRGNAHVEWDTFFPEGWEKRERYRFLNEPAFMRRSVGSPDLAMLSLSGSHRPTET